MADGMTINWDGNALGRAVGQDEGVREKIVEMTNERITKANMLGAGYTTKRTTDRETGKKVGGTTARYGGDVQMSKKSPKWPVGIVHPVNYAAMKDNYLHNTLLKVK